MQRSTRRLAALAVGLLAFVVGSALLYQFGMAELEGKSRTFWDAIEWAAETLSTTGYGYDSHWSHPAMVILVVAVQFVGILLFFLIVPIFLIPFLEERFEERLPRDAGDIAHHIVIYRFGPAVETLLQRLKTDAVPSLVVETDEAAARAVLEMEQRVVFSRAEEDALDVCRLEAARALVANGRDEENAAIVLRARQMGFRGEIFAFVEEPAHRRPIELAGATSAYTPRHIVAAALAAHASDRINPRLPGSEAIPGLERRELRVPASSPVAGKTLGEAEIGARTGAIVIGQWSRSRLQAACGADMRIEPGAILELAGDGDSLDRAAEIIGATFMRSSGPYLIAGFGEVGRKVHELLTDAGEEVRVIEKQPVGGVDFVGNVLDPSMLERAGLRESRGVVLALNTDDATLFATVICRDMASDVPIVARVNHARNIDNIYRAGADYALSISDISGEMLTSRLLGRSRTREQHRNIAQIAAGSAAGKTIADLGLRRSGCSVLAIGRDGSLLIRIGASTRIEPRDTLYVCGSAEALKLLERWKDETVGVASGH
ncbi:MAG TPA: NAD-binding protein [Thermoanaerobaculia bacterium]|nr:NAD-binding protein [Thermoanaerobaculia bacterium]